MERLADTFKALSDETRLQMMGLLLQNEELCVCDFVGALGLTQSKASRHLRYLYHSGLVQDRREGLWMHYRVSKDLLSEQRQLLDTVSEVLGVERKAALKKQLADWLARKEECCEPTSLAAAGEDPAKG